MVSNQNLVSLKTNAKNNKSLSNIHFTNIKKKQNCTRVLPYCYSFSSNPLDKKNTITTKNVMASNSTISNLS